MLMRTEDVCLDFMAMSESLNGNKYGNASALYSRPLGKAKPSRTHAVGKGLPLVQRRRGRGNLRGIEVNIAAKNRSRKKIATLHWSPQSNGQGKLKTVHLKTFCSPSHAPQLSSASG